MKWTRDVKNQCQRYVYIIQRFSPPKPWSLLDELHRQRHTPSASNLAPLSYLVQSHKTPDTCESSTAAKDEGNTAWTARKCSNCRCCVNGITLNSLLSKLGGGIGECRADKSITRSSISISSVQRCLSLFWSKSWARRTGPCCKLWSHGRRVLSLVPCRRRIDGPGRGLLRLGGEAGCAVSPRSSRGQAHCTITMTYD